MFSQLLLEQIGFIEFSMGSIKEGGSTTCPSVLDRTNYSYWKARIAFLKSIDRVDNLLLKHCARMWLIQWVIFERKENVDCEMEKDKKNS